MYLSIRALAVVRRSIRRWSSWKKNDISAGGDEALLESTLESSGRVKKCSILTDQPKAPAEPATHAESAASAEGEEQQTHHRSRTCRR